MIGKVVSLLVSEIFARVYRDAWAADGMNEKAAFVEL
jgi:hypothetical protein